MSDFILCYVTNIVFFLSDENSPTKKQNRGRPRLVKRASTSASEGASSPTFSQEMGFPSPIPALLPPQVKVKDTTDVTDNMEIEPRVETETEVEVDPHRPSRNTKGNSNGSSSSSGGGVSSSHSIGNNTNSYSSFSSSHPLLTKKTFGRAGTAPIRTTVPPVNLTSHTAGGFTKIPGEIRPYVFPPTRCTPDHPVPSRRSRMGRRRECARSWCFGGPVLVVFGPSGPTREPVLVGGRMYK